jgi:hypothetical protein
VHCGEAAAWRGCHCAGTDNRRGSPLTQYTHQTTRTNDLTRKLGGTFQVPSIRHYLIFDANRPSVIHDRRRDDGQDIETRMLPAGDIRLDPPSMTITAKKIYVK